MTISISKEKIKACLIMLVFTALSSVTLSEIHIRLIEPFLPVLSQRASFMLYFGTMLWLLLDNLTLGRDWAEATQLVICLKQQQQEDVINRKINNKHTHVLNNDLRVSKRNHDAIGEIQPNFSALRLHNSNSFRLHTANKCKA